MGSSVTSTQGSEVVVAMAVVALLVLSWALALGVGVSTLITCLEGHEGIFMDGGH